MSIQAPIRFRRDLIEAAFRLCPSRACQRAIRDGRVRVWGGFDPIPPFDRAGWIIEVTSKHGRVWLLALLVNEAVHGLACSIVEEVPWANWIGSANRGEWVSYDGDVPHESAARYGWCNGDSGRPMGKMGGVA